MTLSFQGWDESSAEDVFYPIWQSEHVIEKKIFDSHLWETQSLPATQEEAMNIPVSQALLLRRILCEGKVDI